MKVSTLAFSVLATSVFAEFLDTNQWTSNDIKQFLHDRRIKFEPKADEQELKSIANVELEKLKNRGSIAIDVNDSSNQKILEKATDPNANLNDQLPYHNWDYLFSKSDGEDSSAESWIFESWSADALRRFAKENKIKLDSKTPSKQDLINTIKKSYKSIAESHKSSGFYPGDWLYSSWTLDYLKSWLESYEIEFDPKASKESLIELVKENNYFASSSNKDSKQSLLDSLNLSSKDIFDKAGKIKSEIFDSWSDSQLREWLYYSGIIDTKPDSNSDDYTPEKLKKLAQSSEDSLSSDIKSWYETAKKSANPLIGKGTGSSDWLTNETFLLGINKWSKERLQDFLRAREIKFSRFTPKKQLIDLVNKNRNTPVTGNSSFKWLVGGLSTDSFKGWLSEQGQSIEGTRQDWLNTLSGYIGHAKPQSYKSQTKFYKPDIKQYREYLISNANLSKDKVDKLSDEAVESTYKVASEYYNEAAKALESTYENSKDSIDDTLQEIQDSAYDYSAQFVNDYENNKKAVANHIDETKKAANEWSQYFIDSLNDAVYETAAPAAAAAVEGSQSFVWGLINNVKNAVWAQKQVADEKIDQANKGFEATKQTAQYKAQRAASNIRAKAAEAAKIASQQAGDAANSATKQANQAYNAAGKSASSAAKVAHTQANQAYDAAGKHAANVADAAQKQAGQAYDAAGNHIANAASAVSKQAGEAYDAAGTQVANAASVAQVKGQEYASQAGDVAEDIAKAAKVKGQQVASDVAEKAEELKNAAYAKGSEYANEAQVKGQEYAKEAHAKGQEYANQAQKSVASAYDEHKKVVGKEAGKAYEGAKAAVDQAAVNAKDAANNAATGALGAINHGWNYVLDSFANVDLITYLQSFGFDHAWLVKLNRRQLKILAKEQSKVFYGEKPAWDKSIKDVLVETSGDLSKKLGVQQDSYWNKVRGFF